jgi:RHS repeat-associated protein
VLPCPADALDETDLSGNTNNSTFSEYVSFGGKKIARRDYQANVFYYFADHLGTSREMVQAGQTSPCYDADFYPFGGERAYTTTCTQNYKFTGKERDSESGLDNLGARYNSSSLGRFMSPDPAGVRAVTLKNPQTWNWYAYTMNNPLRYTDPTGKYTCADSKTCGSQQDKDFETARQQALKSDDKGLAAAAKAFGDPNTDNHVSVQFTSGIAGNTSLHYAPGDKKATYSISVQIPGGDVGIALDEDIGHEGTHVAQQQALASTFTPKLAFDATLNLTEYDAENAAYHVNASIIQESGQPRSLDPKGEYFINPEDSPGQVNQTINQFLADKSGPYGVTQQNPGPRFIEPPKDKNQ